MSKKGFTILDFKNQKQIIRIVKKIGNNKLTELSHTYEIYGKIKIVDAADKSTTNYSAKAIRRPAISLIDVVLAANRNYNKVVLPNIRRLEETNLRNFEQLVIILKEKTRAQFYTLWGHKDKKKYKTLKSILSAIEALKAIYPNSKDDFHLMKQWAKNANLSNKKVDLIGRLPNVGVATFQHLRMTFGIDTVKPDQRVKEVLVREFGLTKLNDIKTIKAVEEIAEITKKKVLTIDQIFVKYGSGYYNMMDNKFTVKEIAKRLQSLGVRVSVISKATSLTKEQIRQL